MRGQPEVEITCDQCNHKGIVTIDRLDAYGEVYDSDLEGQGWHTNDELDFCCWECVIEYYCDVRCTNCNSLPIESELDTDFLMQIPTPTREEIEQELPWIFLGGNQFCCEECADEYCGGFRDLAEVATSIET